MARKASAVSVILGDVHLGKIGQLGKAGIGSALNSRIIDQLKLLDWTLEQAINHSADNIIITGDVFQDQKPHPTLVLLFVEWLKQVSSSNITTHIIVGNHDLIRSGQMRSSALDIIAISDIDGVFVHHNMSTITTAGASYTLLPFSDRRSYNTNVNGEALGILGARIPYEVGTIERSQYKVLIGHLTLAGALPVGDEIDDMANELICPLEMFKGYDFTWMGHIHKPQILSTEPYIAHIGSMDLSDFGETDHTKVIVIFNPDEEIPFRYLELPTRPLRQISVQVPADVPGTTEFVLASIREEGSLARAVVRLNVALDNPSAPPIDRRIIEREMMARGAFYIARINEEKKVGLVKKTVDGDDIDNTVNETTAIKMFAEANINEAKRGEFVATAVSIVNEFRAENG
jgi:DNA repair exonuclease SbcCD nuclease subunit